jgi:anti-sigma factor RsiW
MLKPDIQENLMRRYLLGDLPESETNELELQALRDDETFEEIWETENRLVDGYVRGRLSSADRERFERHYQASPVHRQRVEVARKLVAEADGSGPSANPRPARGSWGARLSEKLGFSVLSWQGALAAAVLVLAMGTAWLFVDRSRLRHDQEQLMANAQSQQNREAALSQELATAQDERKRLESEIQRLRVEPGGSPLPTPSTEQNPRPTIYSLLLSPMLVRSGDNPQTATIPSQTDLVRLQMKVGEESASRFQVNVRTVEGRQIWEQQIKPGGRNSIIIAQVPAKRLPVGDYILTLSAVTPTGQQEEVNRYFFRVIGQ